jgi:hypothetical protein
MSSRHDSFIKQIREGYFRPWDRSEKILIASTAAALLLDALTTLEVYNLTRRPYPPYIYLMETNHICEHLLYLGLLWFFLYFLSWLGIIILFRVIRSTEFTLAILHLTGSGLAAINNLGILLFRESVVVSLLSSCGLEIGHLLLITILIYLFRQFYHRSKAQGWQNMFKPAFLYLIGLFLALLIETDIQIIWLIIIH